MGQPPMPTTRATATAPLVRAGRPAPAARPAPATDACAGCGAAVATGFCGECGERRRDADALSLRHLAAEAFAHTTSLDLRLLRTIATLLGRPGEVTRAYVAGARCRYTPPLQLFLLINVVFFLAAPRIGLFRYSMPREMAAAVVARANGPRPASARMAPAERVLVEKVRRDHWTAEELHSRYNAAVEERTRAMVSLWIAMVAFLLVAVHAWRRRYLAEHVVFATHYCTFVLVFVPAVLYPQRAATTWLAGRGMLGAARWVALGMFVSMLVALYAHLAAALRRAYGDRWVPALLRAAVVFGALMWGGGVLFYVAVTTVTARLL